MEELEEKTIITFHYKIENTGQTALDEKTSKPYNLYKVQIYEKNGTSHQRDRSVGSFHQRSEKIDIDKLENRIRKHGIIRIVGFPNMGYIINDENGKEIRRGQYKQ